MEGFLLIVIAIIFAMLFFVSYLFTQVWNVLMAAMFRLPTITLWQGFSLLLVISLLSGILSGNIRMNLNVADAALSSKFEDLRRDIWSVSAKIDQLQQSIEILNQQIQ